MNATWGEILDYIKELDDYSKQTGEAWEQLPNQHPMIVKLHHMTNAKPVTEEEKEKRKPRAPFKAVDGRRSWTSQEIDFLRKNAPNMTVHEMSKELKRTYGSTFHKCKQNGIEPKPANPQKEVIQCTMDWEEVRRFPNAELAAVEMGLNGANIRRVIHGYGHTAGGYRWKFAEGG